METTTRPLDRRTEDALGRLLPRGSRRVTAGAVSGVAFAIHDAYGTEYTLFAWHDELHFQVSVVAPDLPPGISGEHVGLSPEGRLSPIGRNGFDSLDEAFRAAITWVNGVGVLRRMNEPPATIGV